MAEFRNFAINTLLIGLFIAALISFGAQIATDNNSNSTILQDPNINSTLNLLRGNLTNSQGISENQSRAQDETKPIALFDFLFESIIGTGKVLKSSFSNIYNLTFGLLGTTLGIPPIALATFTSIILFIMIFLAWKLFKTGN